MLIPFFVDLESLVESEDEYLDKSELYAFHSRVLSFWKNYGVLVYEDTVMPLNDYRKWFKKIPVELRKRYEVLLTHGPRLKAKLSKPLIPPRKLKATTGFDLALLSVKRANENFGFSHQEESSELILSDETGNGTTLCKGAHYVDTQRFKKWLDDAQSLAYPGKGTVDIAELDHLWNVCFESLVAAELDLGSSTVSIVDRYAFQEELHANDPSPFGMARFIRSLDKSSTMVRQVQIFVSEEILVQTDKRGHRLSEKNENDLRKFLQELKRNCRRERIQKITVYLLPNGAFKTYGHDRHIRFGNFYAWEIGKGVDVFSLRHHARNIQKSFKSGEDLVKQYVLKEKLLVESGEALIKKEAEKKGLSIPPPYVKKVVA